MFCWRVWNRSYEKVQENPRVYHCMLHGYMVTMVAFTDRVATLHATSPMSRRHMLPDNMVKCNNPALLIKHRTTARAFANHGRPTEDLSGLTKNTTRG